MLVFYISVVQWLQNARLLKEPLHLELYADNNNIIQQDGLLKLRVS